MAADRLLGLRAKVVITVMWDWYYKPWAKVIVADFVVARTMELPGSQWVVN